MDRDRLDEWQFWALMAIADRERNHEDIRGRMAELFRASGGSRRVPQTVAPLLKALLDQGLVERLPGRGLLGRETYRLTAAGYQACQNEVGHRRREHQAIDKDVHTWLDQSTRR